MKNYNEIIRFIKSIYKDEDFIPLHAPVFSGKEKEYLSECIDTTFVSYVGEFVTKFEEDTAKYTGAEYAIAVSNGTVGLQIALLVAGVGPGDEVITQPLTFVATANAIKHAGAEPVFLDIEMETMGLSPDILEDWLIKNTKYDTKKNCIVNKKTNNRIAAIVPVHTFGHACRIDDIVRVANKFNLKVVEDSAESLGTRYKHIHTGCFGDMGVISYNGNKVITTGGGGMIITNNTEYARLAKHITTTAKVPHKWEFVHDMIGFNLRLPNLNAAVGCAQMENLNEYLKSKRETANKYLLFFENYDGVEFFKEPKDSNSNYWLNTILFKSQKDRDNFLTEAIDENVMCRPAWRLMNKLEMYKRNECGELTIAENVAERLVNIPSSVRKH